MDGITTSGFFQRWGGLLLLGTGVFVAGYLLFGRKNKPGPSAATGTSLQGMTAVDSNGQPVVEYVPTTGDSYTNVNYNTDSNNTINRPVTTTTQTSESITTQNSNNPTTTNDVPVPVATPVLIPPPPPPPPPGPGPFHQHDPLPGDHIPVDPPLPHPGTVPPPTPRPPAPNPAPPTTTYVVVHGDTLSQIASRYHTTWQNLYNLNKGTIDSAAAAAHYPIPGGPWNNIFVGQKFIVPSH